MIEETLDLVGARELARRPLSEMSGGERQRLLLAQALIGAPKLLLLDEPLISLDPRHQEVAIDVVRKVCSERGITVLFSAHELNPLLGTLDRVLYLGNGQAALGTVDEVITAPVLSRLYGTDIEVVRAEGRIFVMSRGHDVEQSPTTHARPRPWRPRASSLTCSNTTSCTTPSPPPASSRWWRAWSAISWCCAARPSPATRSPMSASPGRPAPC